MTTARVSPRTVVCHYPGCDQLHYPNVPLLRKVYEHIWHNRKEWNQGMWVTNIFGDKARDALGRFIRSDVQTTTCKTAFCFAGHAAYMTHAEQFKVTNYGAIQDSIKISPKLVMNCNDVATHELGLTPEEANRLFAGTNTLRDIKKICESICEKVGDKF